MTDQVTTGRSDLRAAGIAGVISGIAGLMGVGIAAFWSIPPPPPPPDLMPFIIEWHVENRGSLMIALALGAVSVSFFIWFAIGLSAMLRKSDRDSQPSVAMGAAVSSATLVLIGLVSRTVLNFSGAMGGEEFVVRALYDLAGFFTAFAAFPGAVFFFIVGRTVMRSRALPSFVPIGALVLAVLSLGSAAAAMGTTKGGFMAAGGMAQLGVMGLTVLWAFGTGLRMMSGARRETTGPKERP
ncbi:MAG TPA: hypothetical protein VND22_02505 [Actinomycetota bacterium]|nr:hypothetical protein [Actinomycetota bacterium]